MNEVERKSQEVRDNTLINQVVAGLPLLSNGQLHAIEDYVRSVERIGAEESDAFRSVWKALRKLQLPRSIDLIKLEIQVEIEDRA